MKGGEIPRLEMRRSKYILDYAYIVMSRVLAF